MSETMHYVLIIFMFWAYVLCGILLKWSCEYFLGQRSNTELWGQGLQEDKVTKIGKLFTQKNLSGEI